MDKPFYGGQAVLEGVMMRGRRHMAVAVRAPEGNIVVHDEALTSAIYTSRWSRWPFIRGAIALWDSLVLGTRVLMFSANVAVGEAAGGLEAASGAIWLTVLFSLALATALFFVLPVLLVGVVDTYLRSSFLSNLVEKVFRLTLIVGYIGFVGFLPDIKRVFAYHGAEHKAVNAYEDGAPLEVAAVARYSTAHPRCGTAFLLVVVVVSFAAFLLLGQPPLLWRIASRIVLIPIVAGVAYELIRLGGKHRRHPVVKVLLAPGMALQALTTREPDSAQLEVAISALKRVVALEEEAEEGAVLSAPAVPAVS